LDEGRRSPVGWDGGRKRVGLARVLGAGVVEDDDVADLLDFEAAE